MKRFGNLYGQICNTDNLLLAYWKARKGKEAMQEVKRYAASLEAKIELLRRELIDGKVKVGGYNRFVIKDPKERVICSVPFAQRVLHHAVMNICTPLFESRQIDDSYANRVGKGTYAALERARHYHSHYSYCVKLDVRKYFDSIDHTRLKAQLYRMFKDHNLLKVFYDIIDSYDTLPGKGMPIGNLTSQYLANHYLSSADHYAKEQLRIGGYVRYMDDILLYGNDRAVIKDKAKELAAFLKEHLLLELKVFNIRRTDCTTQFLGYRLTSTTMLLSQRSMKRFRSKLKYYYYMYNSGTWDDTDVQRHLVPVLGYVMKAENLAFRRQVMYGKG